MSLLALIVPWVLISFIATPFIGVLLSRCLGSDDDSESDVTPVDFQLTPDEHMIEGIAASTPVLPLQSRTPDEDSEVGRRASGG